MDLLWNEPISLFADSNLKVFKVEGMGALEVDQMANITS